MCTCEVPAQLLRLEMTLFNKKASQNRKTFITQPKHIYGILIK